jgi:hypothetical protein
VSATKPEEPTQPVTRAVGGPARVALLVLGVLATAVAAAGAFLPVLPTTPFLLLASACFVRASPALHRRLLANRMFGPYLRQWQTDRTIPRGAKRKAYGLVIVTFPLSIFLVEGTALRLALAAIGVGLLGFLAWLPTTREE